jgi:hydroxymethylbilane synthase
MSKGLVIGTRGSRLALWQAHYVAERIAALPEAPDVEIEVIQTEGDRITDVPLAAVPGKAFFTKEIEQALLERRVDLAVHSLKDLATEQPAGLTLGAVLEREDPRDVLVSARGGDLEALAPGARVGTSSLRRRALVARWRPDLELAELRGNVPTRLKRLDEGRYDAVVLAAAGVKRLGLGDRISAYLPVERVPPAVAQGAMAVQVRAGDEATRRWVEPLTHPETEAATAAERALLARLEGGCQVPVGALATVMGQEIHLVATVCSLDGASSVAGERHGPLVEAVELGYELAGELLQQGAGAILEAIRRDQEDHR